MPVPPTSTKTGLGQRLRAHAKAHWPGLSGIEIRFRGQFAYIAGRLAAGDALPLCRLRYAGSSARWGFALYRASHDDYQDNVLPSGHPAGSPEDALDRACDLYLNAGGQAVHHRRTSGRDH